MSFLVTEQYLPTYNSIAILLLNLLSASKVLFLDRLNNRYKIFFFFWNGLGRGNRVSLTYRSRLDQQNTKTRGKIEKSIVGRKEPGNWVAPGPRNAICRGREIQRRRSRELATPAAPFDLLVSLKIAKGQDSNIGIPLPRDHWALGSPAVSPPPRVPWQAKWNNAPS